MKRFVGRDAHIAPQIVLAKRSFILLVAVTFFGGMWASRPTVIDK